MNSLFWTLHGFRNAGFYSYIPRKRLTFIFCSPADQAILEAEYKQNPKPNKAARAEIVEKVSLNEKEVQVRISLKRGCSTSRRVPMEHIRG